MQETVSSRQYSVPYKDAALMYIVLENTWYYVEIAASPSKPRPAENTKHAPDLPLKRYKIKIAIITLTFRAG